MLENKNKFNEFHSGISHWKVQRVSAIINIPLIIWFIISIISLRDYSFNENINWLKQPINCILITLMLTSVFYHSSLGLQVVIDFEYFYQSVNYIISLHGGYLGGSKEKSSI